MGLEGIPVSLITAALGLLGGNGIILIFWYVDHRRLDRQYMEHRDEIQKMNDARDVSLRQVLDLHKQDFHAVASFYQSNVELVRNYEKLSNELMRIIELNIQVITQHSDYIKNNMFCPLIREKGPRG